MANVDITKLETSSYDSISDYAIPLQNMDSPRDQEETEWTNPNAQEYWGWFNQNPKVKNAILMKAIWNVGKGWQADERTTIILNKMDGWGKDTAKAIMFNMEVDKRVFGDAYAEIITHNNKKIKDGGKIINLKVLNPMNMKHIVGKDGRIKRFEQIQEFPKPNSKETDKRVIKFDPEEILYLANNRIGDQIHGISDLEALRKVILADSQSFENMQKIINFQAKPFILFKLKTDDSSIIEAVSAKIRRIREVGEDLFIPDDENILSYEVVQVNPSQILMQWRDDIRNEYYRCIGLPQIIPGASGGGTESESKVIYVAFEQIVMHDQLDTEQAWWTQLGLEINLVHPTLIEDLLAKDEAKDANNAFNIQPSELTPGQNENNTANNL